MHSLHLIELQHCAKLDPDNLNVSIGNGAISYIGLSKSVLKAFNSPLKAPCSIPLRYQRSYTVFKGNQKAAKWSNGSKYSKLKKH